MSRPGKRISDASGLGGGVLRRFLMLALVVAASIIILGIIGISRMIGLTISGTLGWVIGIILVTMVGLLVAWVHRKYMSS
jgi:hypothetical protein